MQAIQVIDLIKEKAVQVTAMNSVKRAQVTHLKKNKARNSKDLEAFNMTTIATL